MESDELRRTLAKRITDEAYRLLEFKDRVAAVRAIRDELDSVTRGKPFWIANDLVWRAIFDLRDMLVIDIASWVNGLTQKGSFWPELQAARAALQVVGDDEGAVARRQRLAKRFPDVNGAVRAADLHKLQSDVQKRFALLREDRSTNRAHRYEKKGSAQMVTIEEQAEALDYFAEIFNDLLAIVDGGTIAFSVVASWNHRGAAEKLVDAVMFVLADEPALAFGGEDLMHERTGLWRYERREALYDALHELHNPDEHVSFNVPEALHAVSEELKNRAQALEAAR